MGRVGGILRLLEMKFLKGNENFISDLEMVLTVPDDTNERKVQVENGHRGIERLEKLHGVREDDV